MFFAVTWENAKMTFFIFSPSKLSWHMRHESCKTSEGPHIWLPWPRATRKAAQLLSIFAMISLAICGTTEAPQPFVPHMARLIVAKT